MHRICCACICAVLLLCSGCSGRNGKNKITYQEIDLNSEPSVPDARDRISHSLDEIESVYLYVDRDLPRAEALYIWDFDKMQYTHRVLEHAEVTLDLVKTITPEHAAEIADALNNCFFYNWTADSSGYTAQDSLVVHLYPKDGVEQVYYAYPAHHKKQGYDELNAVLFSHGFYMDDESDKGESEHEYNTGN